MGSKLLHRTTRKLALSETGKIVYAHAQEMLHAAQMAVDSGSSRQTIAQGQLTLSVPKAVGRFVIHPLMAEFFTRYPQVDVCLRLEDRYMDLIDDGVDLALRISQSPSPGLYGKPLMPVSHVICATPEYLRKHGTPEHPQALREHSCISLGETPADSRWKFRRGERMETIQTHGRYAANHTGVRLDAVKRIWESAACHCSPPARHSPMARLSSTARMGIYQRLQRGTVAAMDAQSTYARQNAGDD